VQGEQNWWFSENKSSGILSERDSEKHQGEIKVLCGISGLRSSWQLHKTLRVWERQQNVPVVLLLSRCTVSGQTKEQKFDRSLQGSVRIP